jgi:class 3 adenylate cyclase
MAEEQSILRAAIREHATSLGRQIALDASVLREVTSVGTTIIGDARRGAKRAGLGTSADTELGGADNLATLEGALSESQEVLVAQGAYSREILFLQLLDTDGSIVVDDKAFLADRRNGRAERRLVDDSTVRDLARFGRRMSMRDVPGATDHPPYLEVMVPLVQNGRQAGAVRIGYSKREQEARIAALSARQEHLLMSAIYLVTLAAIGLVALAMAPLRLFARSVTQPLVRLSDLAARVGGGDLSVHADVGGRDEVSALAKRFNGMIEGLRERQVIRETLGRYVGPSVSDAILGGHVELGGEERIVTLLFSDVRGFTTMAEAIRPHEVVRVLNAYFEQMVEAVFKHDGMLDKFIGDGLMAVFGAPRAVPDHAMSAVACALDMRRRLVEVNDALRAAGLLELKIGIGLHTGPVVVGNIGSSKRMEYTAIGDAVNLAARLESQTKEQGVDILISEATYAAVADRVVADRLGEVQVKGKNKVVVIYALRALRAPTPPPGG